MHWSQASLCVVLLWWIASPLAHGQQTLVTAPDAESSDYFGNSIATDGRFLMVGVPGDTDLAPYSGSVRVFERIGGAWQETARLVTGDLVSYGATFGAALDLDGDTLVVGSASEHVPGGAGAGAVHVFVRSGTDWNLEARLFAQPMQPMGRFGEALDIDGDSLIVGAPRQDGVQPGSGRAFLFRRSAGSWSLVASLAGDPHGSISGTQFGSSVAVHGGRALVGARGESVNGQYLHGAAYVFQQHGGSWLRVQKLTGNLPYPAQGFGWACALEGDRILVSSYGNPVAARGQLFLYERTPTGVWTEEAVLQSTPPGHWQGFGSSPVFFGDRIYVGASEDPTLSYVGGSVYVFRCVDQEWRLESKVFPASGASDGFGTSLAIEGAWLAVGTPYHDGVRGAVFVDAGPEAVGSYCTGKTNSAGCVPFLASRGTASVSSSVPFRLVADELVPDQPGFLLYGYQRGNTDFHGGKLCVKLPVMRLPASTAKSVGNPPCSGRVVRDFQMRIQSLADPMLTSGASVHAQFRQRDPLDPTGFLDTWTGGYRFVIAP